VQGILNKAVNMVLSMAKDIPLWKISNIQWEQWEVRELNLSILNIASLTFITVHLIFA